MTSSELAQEFRRGVAKALQGLENSIEKLDSRMERFGDQLSTFSENLIRHEADLRRTEEDRDRIKSLEDTVREQGEKLIRAEAQAKAVTRLEAEVADLKKASQTQAVETAGTKSRDEVRWVFTGKAGELALKIIIPLVAAGLGALIATQAAGG